jgi:hypothetical protein
MNVQSLSQSVNHWQFIYIASATLALLSTFAIVAFAFHWEQHKTALRFSNYLYVLFSLIAVIATIVIVVRTNSLDIEKDLQVAQAQKDAAQAKKDAAKAISDAATANQKAQEANEHAANVEAENLKLGGQVGKDAVTARAAEAALEAKNKETSDFAHGVAIQQQNMAIQAKVSPTLTVAQAMSLANYLKPYAGQNVAVHMTLDTVVIRLGNGIQYALQQAGIKADGSSMDAGQTYQGVSVAVHSPQDVPPLANALVMGLRAQGIAVNPASDPSVPAGTVRIYLGPN